MIQTIKNNRLSKRILASLVFAIALLLTHSSQTALAESSLSSLIKEVQPKIVKIYGAGGLKGLESYQSGFLISAQGHVLTAWSYVLDSSVITVVTDDGRRFIAEIQGADPRLEIAILKIEAEDLTHFNLDDSVALSPSERVLAFSNLFSIATGNEPSSVLHGYVSAVTELKAKRSAYRTTYKGKVYIVDAIVNNPGATGGALTNQQGQLAGVLGKELRSSINNIWLNYSIPISEMRDSIEDILAERSINRRADEEMDKPSQPITLPKLGIVLLPDILNKTPPYVDRVIAGSTAEKSNIQPNDLIIFVGSMLVSSQKELREELSYIDQDDLVQIMVLRGDELVDVTLNEAE
ncbi:MAG: serine protease [Blastopirellula sp.]|nr:MAG: serine protease [Blastopirellula sp.]